MPFQSGFAKTFSAAVVQREAPAASGVYGLSSAREWIYVGESGNIQQSLLEHLSQAGSIFGGRRATGFSFEPCLAHLRLDRQRRLAEELHPACQPGPEDRQAAAPVGFKERS